MLRQPLWPMLLIALDVQTFVLTASGRMAVLYALRIGGHQRMGDRSQEGQATCSEIADQEDHHHTAEYQGGEPALRTQFC